MRYYTRSALLRYNISAFFSSLLVGQSTNPDSPFEMHDWSVKEMFTGDWKSKVQQHIRKVDQVIILCGQSTHLATGVAAELTIAREEKKPYFLLTGYSDKNCKKPTSAYATDKMYDWTWANLKLLIGGAR